MSSAADTASSRFFIALMLPAEVQSCANAIIQELNDRYGTQTAKCPPHITLQAPFLWRSDAIAALEECLQPFASQHSPLPISISGFGSFAPRVLYLKVLKTRELLNLQADLMAHLETTLEIVDPVGRQRPFSPHITVASRHLTRPIFQQAWSDLQTRQAEFHFVSDRLTLLIHRDQRWQIQSEFKLDLGQTEPLHR